MERADAEGFVADFNRTYEEKTELRRICRHRFYGESDGDGSRGEDEDQEGSDEAEGDDRPGETKGHEYDEDALSYFQIGRRTALPGSLVEEGRYSYVSDAAVGALCEGEKSFVAERLTASAEDDEIPTVDDDATLTIEAALGHVEEPNHVLLPRTEEYQEVVALWEEEGRLRRLGDTSYLKGTEGAEEADCWLHRYDPTEEARDAFVLDDRRVTVVQKKGRDTRPPTDFRRADEYDGLNDDMFLGVYFGDETLEGDDTYDEFFEVVYRVVLSEPVVEDGGVCRVR